MTILSESIKGFHVSIIELEAQLVPSTPQVVQDQREIKMKASIDIIKSLYK